MNWLNVRTELFRAPEYIGSEPVARATWFNVTAYCCEQENGGRIIGGAAWKDRQWQQTCGVTLEEIKHSSPLIVIDGDDVVVWHYPLEKQTEIQTKRASGSRGGKKRAENHPPSKTQAELEAESKRNQSPPSTEGNGMEWKENGMEGEDGPSDRTLPTKDSWLARVLSLTADDWARDWWERKWHYAEKTGWLSGSRPITNWEAHQDSLMTYFRSDSSERKAKEPAIVDIAALEQANLEQRKKEQAEIREAVLNGTRE